MKRSRNLVPGLLILLLSWPCATLAEDKTFTFLVTSDSLYEAVEKVERNDRNELTIRRMNE